MNTKRPPVEPLSRPAWDRVEAGVFARLDRGEHLIASSDGGPPQRRVRSWALAGAFAAAAAVSLWWRIGPDEAPLARVAHELAAQAPQVARQETRIVSTDGPTETTIGDAVLTLAVHSDVGVAGSDAEGWSVRLDAGQVECQVAARGVRPAFVVQAGETRVSVVGTRFTVIRTGPTARVSVAEGYVQVDSGDSHVLLGPGEVWPSAPPVPPLVPPELRDAHELLAPPGESRQAPAPSSVEPRKKAAYVVTPRAQQRFERATRLEAKDPAAALSIYRQLARGKGPWAANALYAQARLELERGRPQRSEPLLRQYLERHPQGLNAADVRKLLARIEN